MKAIRLALGDLLAADPATLAPATDANKIALIAAPFAATEDLVIGDLTFATFTGSAPKAGATGDQQSGIDPPTGDQVITILAPAGGYRFECTVAPGAPETIYGWALTDNAGTTLLAVGTLTSPVAIAAVSDFIDLGAVTMTFVLAPLY